jgi:hypothetical protein
MPEGKKMIAKIESSMTYGNFIKRCGINRAPNRARIRAISQAVKAVAVGFAVGIPAGFFLGITLCL